MIEDANRQRWLQDALDDYFDKKLEKFGYYRKEKKYEDVRY